MDLLSFIQTVNPTKVRVSERQRAEDEPRLLDTTVGRVVPLLPIALAHVKSELDASVDKLFDEGGSGNQAEQKTIVFDAGGPSHPPKKLREDHRTPRGAPVGGKSSYVVQRLLAGAVQNAEVRGEPIPTLPFVTSFVYATPEREDEGHTDSATELNLRTIGAPPRFVISLDSFARPSVPLMTMAITVTSTVDPATTVKEKFVGPSIFHGDSFSGGDDHTVGGFFDLTRSDFILGGIHTVISPDTDLQKHDQLFTEFNVGAARQISLSAEVRMRAEYNIKEKRRLNSVEAEATEAIHLRAKAFKFEVVEKSLRDEVKVLKEQNATLEQERTDLGMKVADLAASVKVREQEVADLDAQFQDEKMKEVNEKFDKLCTDFVEMALQLEEKFYSHLLTTISRRQWLLTHGMELAIIKCLNSTEYLSTLGAVIGKAV
ncbi:hypothetical protein Tco_0335415 [Tanacetum coccineum]